MVGSSCVVTGAKRLLSTRVERERACITFTGRLVIDVKSLRSARMMRGQSEARVCSTNFRGTKGETHASIWREAMLICGHCGVIRRVYISVDTFGVWVSWITGTAGFDRFWKSKFKQKR